MCKAARVLSGIEAIRRGATVERVCRFRSVRWKERACAPSCTAEGEGLGASLLVLSVWAECAHRLRNFAGVCGRGVAFVRFVSGERLMLLGKNTKNIENAKELTKKYGPSVEEINII